MNLYKFYHNSLHRACGTKERYGQVVFNYLKEVRPDLSAMIQGTNKDPCQVTLLNDPTWDRFIHFIETNWYA